MRQIVALPVFAAVVLRIRIYRIHVVLGLLDPYPGSINQRFGSGSGSFYH
jgi:hypothetical protein